MDITTNSAVVVEVDAQDASKLVHVGLDVHKDSISIAAAIRSTEGAPLIITDCGKFRNTPAALKKKVHSFVARYGTDLHFVYEAGPCGYALLRRLRDGGWPCDLVAPTAIPKKPGDRVKTDRRDARALAQLSAVGYIEPLWVPDPAQEAFRNLIRDRTDVKELTRRQRQRIQHFLLRQERCYEGTKWTEAHRCWLHDLKFNSLAGQLSLRAKTDLLGDLDHRLTNLERDIDQEM